MPIDNIKAPSSQVGLLLYCNYLAIPTEAPKIECLGLSLAECVTKGNTVFNRV
jgi:hypothetical protein